MLPFLSGSLSSAGRVIDVTLATRGATVISTLFSGVDWASPNLKRVFIPAGVTISSSSPGTPALDTGTGLGGKLEIIHAGSIDGAGGLANSGVGGTAFKNQVGNKCKIRGNGATRAGGGGGGAGGAGGGGVFYTARTQTDGPSYGGPNDTCVQQYNGGLLGDPRYFWWAGVNVGSAFADSATFSGYTYTKSGGALGSDGTYYYSAIIRQYTVVDVPNYTSGGGGGNGGRGEGADGSAASGSTGSGGGTNAGTGATGGTGGAFGSNGSNGSTGASGNNGSGVTGTTGGLAGYAIDGVTGLDVSQYTGTASGRQV